ncbi:hypothetical protein P692DRAFT_201871814 [Suillus brevipes Sb2]|nr:hypothetical protein P692DRAFT_201871814 [Suillus brevipes Sb2]
MNSNATRCSPIQARRTPRCFFDGVQNGAQHVVPILVLAVPKRTFSNASRRSSTTFMPMEPLNSSNAQRGPSFLADLPLSECLQYVTNSRCLLLADPNGSSTTPHAPGTTTATPGARPTHSRFVQLLAHLVLFLCCTSAQRAGANAQPTQIQLQAQAQTHATSSQPKHHQGQSQGPPQAQASSSQTRPTAPSTSATPTAPNARTTAPGAARAQPRPLPWRTRFVLFLCCASLPHANGR